MLQRWIFLYHFFVFLPLSTFVRHSIPIGNSIFKRFFFLERIFTNFYEHFCRCFSVSFFFFNFFFDKIYCIIHFVASSVKETKRRIFRLIFRTKIRLAQRSLYVRENCRSYREKGENERRLYVIYDFVTKEKILWFNEQYKLYQRHIL